MADLITKVQGAVIDLDSSGGGPPGIILPTPELIEKFDVGDVWETSKNAESYYDKDYIICFDTPTTVTKEDGEWYESYKIPIPFEDTVSINPVHEIPFTGNSAKTIEKSFLFDGGVLYKYNRSDVYYFKDGVNKLLNNLNPSTTIVDINSFEDELGDRWFYGCSRDKAYRSLNPSDNISPGNYELVYEFDSIMDEYHIHQEGDNVYIVYFLDQVANCVLVSHSGIFEPYVLWSGVSMDFQGVNYKDNFVKYLDEIFYKDIVDGFITWNKINIKTGFITKKIVSKELAEAYYQSYGNVNFTTTSLARANGMTSEVSIDIDKNLYFAALYLITDEDGTQNYINFSFSRSKGLSMIITDRHNYNTGRQIIDNRFLMGSGMIAKNIKFNSSDINTFEIYSQVYDGYLIQELYYSSSVSTHFYGLVDDPFKNYVIALNQTDGKYYVCEINFLDTDGYLLQATVPAMLTDDPTLQFYGRKK